MLSTKFYCCYFVDESRFYEFAHLYLDIPHWILGQGYFKVMSFNLLRLFVTVWCSFSVRRLPGRHCKMVITFLEALWNSADFSLVKFKEKNTLIIGTISSLSFGTYIQSIPTSKTELLRLLLKFVSSLTAGCFRTFLNFRRLLKQYKLEPHLWAPKFLDSNSDPFLSGAL